MITYDRIRLTGPPEIKKYSPPGPLSIADATKRGSKKNTVLSKIAMLENAQDGSFIAWRSLAALNEKGEYGAD